MRRFALVALASALACNNADDTDDTDVGATADTDGNTSADTDPVAQDDTDAPGDPNAKANGVWSLATAGSTCNMNFAGDWDGAAAAGNALGFTLTQQSEGGQTLSCLFDATAPTQFTCTDKTFGGTIPPNCTVSIAIASVTGTVTGAAASLSLNVQMTSPNCAQALNCGPSAHSASGSIAP